jgi:hypothetical protein
MSAVVNEFANLEEISRKGHIPLFDLGGSNNETHQKRKH